MKLNKMKLNLLKTTSVIALQFGVLALDTNNAHASNFLEGLLTATGHSQQSARLIAQPKNGLQDAETLKARSNVVAAIRTHHAANPAASEATLGRLDDLNKAHPNSFNQLANLHRANPVGNFAEKLDLVEATPAAKQTLVRGINGVAIPETEANLAAARVFATNLLFVLNQQNFDNTLKFINAGCLTVTPAEIDAYHAAPEAEKKLHTELALLNRNPATRPHVAQSIKGQDNQNANIRITMDEYKQYDALVTAGVTRPNDVEFQTYFGAHNVQDKLNAIKSIKALRELLNNKAPDDAEMDSYARIFALDNNRGVSIDELRAVHEAQKANPKVFEGKVEDGDAEVPAGETQAQTDARHALNDEIDAAEAAVEKVVTKIANARTMTEKETVSADDLNIFENVIKPGVNRILPGFDFDNNADQNAKDSAIKHAYKIYVKDTAGFVGTTFDEYEAFFTAAADKKVQTLDAIQLFRDQKLVATTAEIGNYVNAADQAAKDLVINAVKARIAAAAPVVAPVVINDPVELRRLIGVVEGERNARQTALDAALVRINGDGAGVAGLAADLDAALVRINGDGAGVAGLAADLDAALVRINGDGAGVAGLAADLGTMIGQRDRLQLQLDDKARVERAAIANAPVLNTAILELQAGGNLNAASLTAYLEVVKAFSEAKKLAPDAAAMHAYKAAVDATNGGAALVPPHNEASILAAAADVL